MNQSKKLLVSRIQAYILDICTLLWIFFSLLAILPPNLSRLLFENLCFSIYICYGLYFFASHLIFDKSFGKFVFRLSISSAHDLTSKKFIRLFLREFLYKPFSIGLFYLGCILTMRQQNSSVHDLLAKTTVDLA